MSTEVIIQKLTILHLLKDFPPFYETSMHVQTVLTKARYVTLSQLIQSSLSFSILLKSLLMLSSHPS
jgi:hypothetical protein